MSDDEVSSRRRGRLAWLGGVAAATLAALAVVLGSALAVTQSEPVSAGDVTPYIVDNPGPGGNVTCQQLGYELSSSRNNFQSGSFAESWPSGISVTVPDGTYVQWSSTFPIGAVIVKGSNAANIYEYIPQANGDSGLASPLNASGNPAGLSNLTFCWNPVRVQDEGCTIGYWKQPHHVGSWSATGYQTSTGLQNVFGPNAIADTFINALSFPGGPGLEGGKRILLRQAVGALLNAAHPDIDYPLSEAQVISQVTAALGGTRNQMVGLATTLDRHNSAGCPLGRADGSTS